MTKDPVNKDRLDLKVELDNAMREIEHDRLFYKEKIFIKNNMKFFHM